MALTDFSIVKRSLMSRRLSTLITALTVAVAVALMLVLLSTRDAGHKAFFRGTGNMHILVSADASPLASVLNSVFYARAPQRAIPYERFQQILLDPRVAFAAPIQQGDSWRGYPTLACDASFFTSFKPDAEAGWKIARGGFPADTFDVVLGFEAARGTGAQIGDKVVITHGQGAGGHEHDEHPYQVVGILEPTGSPHDRAVFITLDSTWLIHADDTRHAKDANAEEPTLANLKPSEKLITGIYVGVKSRPGSSAPTGVPELFAELRRDPSITVALPSREVEQLFAIVGQVDRIILAIAMVVFLTSGITIMLALYNSMEQRRRQIAVLRVLGASQWRVFSLVLTESAFIGLIGGVLGVIIGQLGTMALAAALKAQLGLVVGSNIEPAWAMVIVCGAIVLACAAGLVPAFAGYRTSVVRGLRPIG